MKADEMFRLRLKNRAERLVRLLQLEGPDSVVANEVMLVLKAAFGLFPQEIAEGLSELITAQVRYQASLCGHCDEILIPNGDPLCPDCRRKEEEELDEDDEDGPEEQH